MQKCTLFAFVAKGLLLITSLLCLHTTFAQQQKKLAISIAPLALIDEFSFPAIQTSVRYKLNNRIGLMAEAGFHYRHPLGYNRDSTLLPFSGIRLKAEVRYYVIKKSPQFDAYRRKHPGKAESSLYYAANIFYKKEQYTSSIKYYPGDSLVSKLDYFGVQKKVWGFNFLIGCETYKGKRWMIDAYVGLGLRQRQVANTGLDRGYGEFTRLSYNIGSLTDDINMHPGTKVLAHITGGVRIGYRF